MDAGTVADDIGDVLILSGAGWSLLAGIGMLRLPDVLTRMHAATKPQVLGLLMILLGVAFRLRDANDITTLFLVGLFQTWTVPVAAHMVARAARQEDGGGPGGAVGPRAARGGPPGDGGAAPGGTGDGRDHERGEGG